MPATAHRCYSKAFFSLYLIGQQSGLAKAKPLTMHNKTLIQTLCLGRHRRPVKAGPCERRRAPSRTTGLAVAKLRLLGPLGATGSTEIRLQRVRVLHRPGANRQENAPISLFPCLPP